jgi:ribonuclease HIII
MNRIRMKSIIVSSVFMKGVRLKLANTVIQVDATTMKKMKDYYQKDARSPLPQGAVFSAKPPSCSITGYKSGKVLFQGASSESELQKWSTSTLSKPPTITKKESTNKLPAGLANWSMIGSDEVGTGDFFGPITVVAAYVKNEQLTLLKEIGVKDSKNLKDPQIIKIAKDLIKIIPYSLLTLHNPKYNQLQQSGMSQGKIKAILHNQAIIKLIEKILPEVSDGILIDQFAQKDIYYRYLANQPQIVKENVYFSTKGESIHLAVAAASIIARYAFVKAMDQLGEVSGVVIPKGAGPKVDQVAAKILLSQGEQALNNITKAHFANTEKAKLLASKKRHSL